jgi:hypothetical protein
MHNTKGRKDATGAFQPEAERFVMIHHGMVGTGDVRLFDNKKPDQYCRDFVLREIDRVNSLYPPDEDVRPMCIAFFCHGFKRGIQCGFKLQHVNELAAAMFKACNERTDIIVPLYACDTGRDLDADRRDDLEAFGGDGGFADSLRDALCRAGAVDCEVLAHTTAGHASRNPNLRRYSGNGSVCGGVGGHYIVPMKSPLWKKWRVALRTDFRFKFPFMTDAEIHDYLRST